MCADTPETLDYKSTLNLPKTDFPMRAGLRSLNVAVAGAIVLGEALRQTGGWDELTD